MAGLQEFQAHQMSTEIPGEEIEASKRALQKAGYRQSGTQHEEMYRDGRWHDIWMGEVLREDWEKTQENR